ncbi:MULTISPECIES: zinc-dependent alcohol dehydrogenase family protein [unclassified Afipia]|uniref:zinc-dependent alcohol dehydrogenase family protein n=1 Tax=unclassified Afipia TaxID=2642050 RepID=UPI0003FAEBAF|nr:MULTISPECIES: zinc-dependent alcohol dehydrogenase family protein [unclassified Afipia]
MKAIQLQAFGNPAEAVKLADIPDVGDPASNEVIAAVEASPINATDLLIMAGRYGYLPPLPAVMGVEGVARVIAVGSNVKHLKEGDRTLIPWLQPTWTERVKLSASWLRPLPKADIQQLSMLGINPATAYLLLTDIVKVPRGGWVIQNGANSSTARALIPIAKSLGIKTVNVVRRPEVVDEIKALGGDVVLVDGPDLAKRVAAETGKAPIPLAIDMVADTSTANLMNCLAPDGVLVFYSAMSGKPFVGPAQPMIFKNISLRGFWLGHWFKTATDDKLVPMYEHLAGMIASGAITAPVAATYSFDKFPEAIAKAAKFSGKIILTPN